MKKITYLMLMCCFGASAVQGFESTYYTDLIAELDCDTKHRDYQVYLESGGLPNLDLDCDITTLVRDNQKFTLAGIENGTLANAANVEVKLDYEEELITSDEFGTIAYDKLDCADLSKSSTGVELEKGSYTKNCTVYPDIINSNRTLTANGYSFDSGYGYEIAIEDMPDPANDFPATYNSYNFDSGSVNFRDDATGEYKVVDSADYKEGTHSCVSTHSVKLYVNSSNTWRSESAEPYAGEEEYDLKPNLFTTWKGNDSSSTDVVRIYNYYFCGAENVNNYLYKRHTSVEDCVLTPTWDSNTGARVLQTVRQDCALYSTKRVYWGHKDLVPVQVGDITTFLPIDAMDTGAIRTDKVWDDSIQYPAEIINKPTSRVELSCVGTNLESYHNWQGTIPADGFVRLSFDAIEDSINTSSANSFIKQCTGGIRLNSTFVTSTGASLPFTIVEGISSDVEYQLVENGNVKWLDTAKYLQEKIDDMVTELTILNTAVELYIDGAVLEKEVLCAASEMMHSGLGDAMGATDIGSIMDTESLSSHFQTSNECNDTGSQIWWKYADNVTGLDQAIANGETVNGTPLFDYTIGEFADDSTIVTTSKSIIEDVNAMSGSEVTVIIQNRHESVMDDLEAYINYEVSAYMTRAQDLATRYSVESCTDLKTAVGLMLEKLNEYNSNSESNFNNYQSTTNYSVSSVSEIDCTAQ